MNWLRILLDGAAMCAVFNLATGLIMLLNPVTFTTAYPAPIQKAAPKNPRAMVHKLLFTLLVILPVLLFGAYSLHTAQGERFWPMFLGGYAQWFLVNLGDFFGLDLYLREKAGRRLELPGTEGHPCYSRKSWMKSLAIPEHFVLWPLIICPMMAAIQAGLVLLLHLL